MTLTPSGIDYICQKFGNASNCCIDTGLSWYYTAGGTNYNEIGGTAQVVSRLASGLVDSVTMTNPARGTFTRTQLNTANGEDVTLLDCQQITQHDSPAEQQYCYQGTNVTCWRCNGATPESSTFPSGTICGQGVAASYPENTQPDCGGDIQCWKCIGKEPYMTVFSPGTICGQGEAADWPYSSVPNCSGGFNPLFLLAGILAVGLVGIVLLVK